MPEDAILVFPIAIRKTIPTKAQTILETLSQKEVWQPFLTDQNHFKHDRELYFGGLESIGCGRCRVSLAGEYVSIIQTQESKP